MTKRIGLILGLGIASLASMQAAAVATPCTTQTYNASIATYTCEIGDKIFSNFTGDFATGGSVSFTQITSTQYGLTYTAGATAINGTFNFGFTVAVDTTTNPTFFISQITDQMNTVQNVVPFGLVPNASTAAVTHTPGGVVNLNAAGTGTGQSGAVNLFTQSDIISMVYTGNGAPANGVAGQLTSMEFRISQTTVPEPATLSLMGLSLLGLGLIRRRQQGRK